MSDFFKVIIFREETDSTQRVDIGASAKKVASVAS